MCISVALCGGGGGGGGSGGGNYRVLLLTLHLALRQYFTRIRLCGPDSDPRGTNIYHPSLVDEELEGGEGFTCLRLPNSAAGLELQRALITIT